MEQLNTTHIGRHEVITAPLPNDIRSAVYHAGKSTIDRITRMRDEVSVSHNQAKGEWTILLYQGVYISLKPTIVYRHMTNALLSMHDGGIPVCKHVPFLHIRNKCIPITMSQVRQLLTVTIIEDERI